MKEAYYFSHDSNARSDSKIVRLRRKFGMEGYGVYFAIIEMLREDSAHKLLLSGFEDIAYDLRVDVSKVESVVKDFDLFVIEDDFFYSARLSRSMQKYYEMKRKRVEAGSVGGKKSKKVVDNQEIESAAKENEDVSDKQNESNAQAMLKQNESTPQALKEKKGKERKVNESKEQVETCYSFSDFWNDYGKKVDKHETQKKWEKIDEQTRSYVKSILPRYVADTPVWRFRKDPSTFLNQKKWLDYEVETPKSIILAQTSDEEMYWSLIARIDLKPMDNGRFTYDERKFIIDFQATKDRFPPDDRKLVQDTCSLTRAEIDQKNREEGWIV